ncbi:MAG: type IV secretion system protein [Pseudomonadota bacterium]
MPKFRSKFQTILSFLFLLLFLNSCDRGCVESYQFDSENRYVDANPISDGIFGGHYDNTSGGEVAAWHNTAIASDGNQMVFEIRGAWTAWDEANTEPELNALPECNICAKKAGEEAGINNYNCICAPGQNPAPELDSFGNPLDIDCSDPEKQEDPNKCSCTKAHGNISDFGTYFIATNYQNKDESAKLPDEQEPCRYTRGLGLYVGLFGKDGNTMPIRVYHMYPTQEICDITRNSQGRCIDDSGSDQTKYVYKSPNNKGFIKDDKSNNNGSDSDPQDDEYYKAGEMVKFIIDDRYYRDNYGGYDINFMSGFLRQDDSGLLEYIVSTVEDAMLGKISADGSKREGGAVEFMYNSIVKDSAFIVIVQLCLVMYITLFGITVLTGTLQISKKELVNRIVQVALIIFFTTQTSWYFYNQIVVGFFKDGMDAIISIFMTASDSVVDQSSLIVTAQMERAQSLSHATRFSYVDIVIKKLLSSATAKKVLSLVFGEWFGIPYVLAIYALIFAFVYVMLTAALVYIKILLGLIFVLCLGPIFMVTLLFGATKSIFKRWLSYMASQSMQIICLFLVVYLFVILIDKDFTELLSYRACTVNINFGLFNINFLRSETSRGLFTWLTMFVKIGALLFLLKMIMEKIPGFVGHMISVGGQAADNDPSFVSNTNKSAFGLAGDLLGRATSAAKLAWSKKSAAISAGKTIAGFVGRQTGISSAVSAAREAIPFRGPMRRWEDRKIDNLIKAQKAKAGKTSPEADKKIREGVMAEGRKAGINDQALLKRLDQKLVVEPLKKAIVDEIKKIKKNSAAKDIPLDRDEMRNAVKAKIEAWAKLNSSLDPSKFTDLLEKDSFKSLIRREGALTSSEAAKAFAGDAQAQDRYLQHLQQEQVTRQLKAEKSRNKWYKDFANAVKRGARGIQGKAAYNPADTRKNFLSKLSYEEREKERKSLGAIDDLTSAAVKKINQGRFNRLINRKKVAEDARVAQKDALQKYFEGDGLKKDQKDNQIERIDAHKKAAMDLLGNEDFKNQQAFEKGKMTPQEYQERKQKNDDLRQMIEDAINGNQPAANPPAVHNAANAVGGVAAPEAPAAVANPVVTVPEAPVAAAPPAAAPNPEPPAPDQPNGNNNPPEAPPAATAQDRKPDLQSKVAEYKSKVASLTAEAVALESKSNLTPEEQAKLQQLKGEIQQFESKSVEAAQQLDAVKADTK